MDYIKINDTRYSIINSHQERGVGCDNVVYIISDGKDIYRYNMSVKMKDHHIITDSVKLVKICSVDDLKVK